jgi:transcriptional regulator with XRE-family HTH domain
MPEPNGFAWSNRSVVAAQLLAEGNLRQDEVAERVNVHRNTLLRWLKSSEFTNRIDSIVDEHRKAVRRRGLAILERRVDALNDRWLALHRVIQERAKDPSLADIPGGQTGLVVRTVRAIGKGENFERIELYEVDTGLLNEIRQHEKQAAQELGQWVEKGSQEISGPGGGAIPFADMVDKIYGDPAEK